MSENPPANPFESPVEAEDPEPLFEGDPDDPPVPVSSAGSESEEDVSSALSATRASLSSTDWTIETIVRQMRKGRIDLDPKFQRRAAWTDATRSRFIESAVLAYPIPQLVLAELEDKPGHFFVIDGKQRLLALRQFYAGQDDDADLGFRSLTLAGLTILKELKGYDVKRLEAERTDLFDAFENHTIRTVVIRNWVSEDFLFTLFLRLNTGSVPLSPQELRQALVPGMFVDFADLRSGRSAGLQALLGNAAPDRRMVDAELLIRFLGFQIGSLTYKGNLKVFLDDTCRAFNERWPVVQAQAETWADEMDSAIAAARTIFGAEHACHKWSGTRWERSFNKAIFDVQVGALSTASVRDAAIQKSEDIEAAFKALCTYDAEFSNAISTTTKSLAATRTRFSRWYEVMSQVTGLPVPVPASIRL